MNGQYDILNLMYYYALRNDAQSVNELYPFAVRINESKNMNTQTYYDIDNILNSIKQGSSINLLHSIREQFLDDAQERLNKLYLMEMK